MLVFYSPHWALRETQQYWAEPSSHHSATAVSTLGKLKFYEAAIHTDGLHTDGQLWGDLYHNCSVSEKSPRTHWHDVWQTRSAPLCNRPVFAKWVWHEMNVGLSKMCFILRLLWNRRCARGVLEHGQLC